MPIPLGILIGGLAASAGTSIFGAASANRTNRELAQEQAQFNLQNQIDQRNFDLEMWERANAYNSPQAQMARFAEAGLNPHLIYGKGTAGNATPLRSPDVKPYTRAEAKSVTNGIDVFGDFMRFKQLDVQTDNLKAQEELIKQDALLKAQQTANLLIQGDQLGLDFEIAKELKDTQVEAGKIGLEKAIADLDIRRADAEVATNTVKARINQAEANFKRTVQETKNLNIKFELMKFERELNSLGLTKTDDKIWRVLGEMWNDIDTKTRKEIFDWLGLGKIMNKAGNPLTR